MIEGKILKSKNRKNNFLISNEEGLRLDRFLISKGLNSSLVQKLVRKKLIKVNNQKTQISYRLQNGDNIIIFADLDFKEKIKTTQSVSKDVISKFKNSIIFQDQNLIAINKAIGLAVQGGSGIKTSIDDIISNLNLTIDEKHNFLNDDKTQKKLQFAENPKLVHRLDKDTSGILLIARNRKSADLLTQAFKEKTIKKTYLALVKGIPTQEFGTIDIPLLKKYHGKIEKVYSDQVSGKKAVTHYQLIKYYEDKDCSLLEVNPVTGRTHQIRVHLKEIGHPIIGDFKYGSNNTDFKNLALEKRLYLHAFKIEMSDFFGSKLEISTHKNLKKDQYLRVFAISNFKSDA